MRMNPPPASKSIQRYYFAVLNDYPIIATLIRAISFLCKHMLTILFYLFLLEACILHYYLVSSIHSVVSTSTNNVEDTWFVRSFVSFFKLGGLLTVQEQVVDRFVFHENRLIVDTSDSGEFAFIYHRMQSRNLLKTPEFQLVVDIGANDGLLSSNSFNFIQLGWSAVLVDPVEDQLTLAKRNVQRYHDPWQEGKQFVEFFQVAVGTQHVDRVEIVVAQDFAQMETNVVANQAQERQRWEERGFSPQSVFVEQITVKELVARSQSFRHDTLQTKRGFGVLSVDAEGLSAALVMDFISLGYRPLFIVYETAIHETLDITTFLTQHGYVVLKTRRHWNSIAEFRGSV